MTRKECEKRVIDLLKEVAVVCGAYKPGLSVMLNVSKGGTYLSAFAFEKDDEDCGGYALDTVLFPDGTLKTDGQYIRRDGSV